MANDNSHLVYSTETGRMCPSCGRPLKKCGCKNKHSKSPDDSSVDGILRIKRETKGRGGKTVTTISGFDENDDVVKKLASHLKNLCGTGGSAKNGVIMIQGDHREAIKTELEKQGFKTKLAGG
jgi:translation initiation factor 1